MAKKYVTLYLFVALNLGGIVTGFGGQADIEDQQRAQARQFCRLFIEGKYAELHLMMSVQMQAAMPEEVANTIRQDILGNSNATLGDPWLEVSSEGFRRYRIPVNLESATIDLRVVFDGDNKVAGFFKTTHTPEPSGRSGEGHAEAPEFLGHWEGAIEIPGTPLQTRLDLSWQDGLWSGTIDFPSQGALGMKINSIEINNRKISFKLDGIPGDPSFSGALSDSRIEGVFAQSGLEFPFQLGQTKSAGPPRPQTPQAPFPYVVKDVSYDCDGISIAGTLTLPKGDGPFPAALLISGSGPQNRDEEIFQHRPFWVMADFLTRGGVGVLRVDDRGVGKSTGDRSQATSEDFAKDASAGVAFLKNRPEIAKNNIGLIGHSEGGIIAPIVAAENSDVAFMVLLAAPGVSGKAVLVHQLGLLTKAAGADQQQVESIRKGQERVLDSVLNNAPDDELRDQIRALIAVQIERPPAAVDEKTVETTLLQMRSPWMRFFLTHDPASVLKKIKIPVLAINGGLDLQIDPKQNLPEIGKALEAADNQDYTLKELPGLNHLLQQATTGTVQEYFEIEETMNHAALELILQWIAERSVISTDQGHHPGG